MTVRELINELQKYDLDLIVINEYSGELVDSIFEDNNCLIIE